MNRPANCPTASIAFVTAASWQWPRRRKPRTPSIASGGSDRALGASSNSEWRASKLEPVANAAASCASRSLLAASIQRAKAQTPAPRHFGAIHHGPKDANLLLVPRSLSSRANRCEQYPARPRQIIAVPLSRGMAIMAECNHPPGKIVSASPSPWGWAYAYDEDRLIDACARARRVL